MPTNCSSGGSPFSVQVSVVLWQCKLPSVGETQHAGAGSLDAITVTAYLDTLTPKLTANSI